MINLKTIFRVYYRIAFDAHRSRSIKFSHVRVQRSSGLKRWRVVLAPRNVIKNTFFPRCKSRVNANSGLKTKRVDRWQRVYHVWTIDGNTPGKPSKHVTS